METQKHRKSANDKENQSILNIFIVIAIQIIKSGGKIPHDKLTFYVSCSILHLSSREFLCGTAMNEGKVLLFAMTQPAAPDIDYLLLMTKHEIQDLEYQIEIKDDYFYNINYYESDHLRKFTRIFTEHNHMLEALVKERFHKACLIETAFYFRVIQLYLEAGPIRSRYGRFFSDEFFANVIKYHEKESGFLTSPRAAKEISRFLGEVMFRYYLQDKNENTPEIYTFQYPIIRGTFKYVAESFRNEKVYDFYKSELDKFNPYHGPDGRFVSRPAGTGNSDNEHEPGSKPKPVSTLTDEQKKELKQSLGCSDETVSYIRNYEEGLFYVAQNLTEKIICGKNVLCPDINPYTRDNKGKTNLENMKDGTAPILDSGSKAHLHHIGQCENSPLAILAGSVHTKFTKLLHPDPWSDIDRGKCSGTREMIYIELSKQI